MDILILTSLTHISAVFPFIQYGRIYDPLYWLYCAIILNTAFVSAIWHSKGEPHGFWFLMDYSMTSLMFVMDGYISHTRCDIETTMIILRMNSVIGMFHMFVGANTTPHYAFRHSMWQLLSAAKCVVVSYLLMC